MAEKSDAPPVVAADVPDPDQVPVRHVSGAFSVITGGTIMLNLMSDRLGMRLDGTLYTDPIIAARLRMDLEMARLIRDQLDAHLSGLSATRSPDQKPN
ncbi:hypothetical protein MKK75_00225 [Methylobacterium sp. J-030]|uniref:hypothetical protein n=1 Tax=Methylobacterium sp. J-030 TaxID=2836627 RepID=UPI001FBA1461|nr:hypothetical protein [Methylobacterium sp. J-030]MCJ2067247.1 hypothetical protein [Methylobacterium sp. J-030]